MDTGGDGTFRHDGADVTEISFVLEEAKSGRSVIRVLTDVFVLLVF